MKKWKHEINLSRRWKESWDNNNVHELGKVINVILKRFIVNYQEFEDDYTLLDVIECFDSICTKESALEINEDNEAFSIDHDSTYFEIIPMEEFDECMRGLYDWADRESVWVKTSL